MIEIFSGFISSSPCEDGFKLFFDFIVLNRHEFNANLLSFEQVEEILSFSEQRNKRNYLVSVVEVEPIIIEYLRFGAYFWFTEDSFFLFSASIYIFSKSQA